MSIKLNNITIEQLRQLQKDGATFVLNITANWCPDCTERQVHHLPQFSGILKEYDVTLYGLMVQEVKGEFLSDDHQKLVEELGGHGYPRTVFFADGQAVDSDNVEVITEDGLQQLANRFAKLIKKPA